MKTIQAFVVGTSLVSSLLIAKSVAQDCNGQINYAYQQCPDSCSSNNDCTLYGVTQEECDDCASAPVSWGDTTGYLDCQNGAPYGTMLTFYRNGECVGGACANGTQDGAPTPSTCNEVTSNCSLQSLGCFGDQ